jgi:hypothetical protein
VNGNQQLVAVALFLVALEVVEFFAVRKEALDVFTMKVGWRAFYIITNTVLLFSSIYLLPASHRSPKGVPVWWFPLLLTISLLTRPKTLVTTSAGLASYGSYGIRQLEESPLAPNPICCENLRSDPISCADDRHRN